MKAIQAGYVWVEKTAYFSGPTFVDSNGNEWVLCNRLIMEDGKFEYEQIPALWVGQEL